MSHLSMEEKLNRFSDIKTCPIRNVISRFSGKWSMLLLCVLAENESIRFGEISKIVPDISQKVLTDTLRNLESSGLISRKVYAEIPPRVEYSLTELGKSLMPHIKGLVIWALDNYASIFPKSKH